MATIRRLQSGAWNCQVRLKGFPSVSRTFRTKREAYGWGKQEETAARQYDPAKTQHVVSTGQVLQGIPSGNDMENAQGSRIVTLADLLQRYRSEITPTKKGHVQEVSRINNLIAQLGHLPVTAVTPKTIAEYRDSRLKVISSGSVLRDIQILSHLFTVAILDWGITDEQGKPITSNPVKLARKPKKARARDRRLHPGELEKLLQGLQGTPTLQSLVALLKRG